MRGTDGTLCYSENTLHNNGEHAAVDHSSEDRSHTAGYAQRKHGLGGREGTTRGCSRAHRVQGTTSGARGRQASSPDPLPKGCPVTRRVSRIVYVRWERRRERGPDADWFQQSATSVPKRLLGAEFHSQD